MARSADPQQVAVNSSPNLLNPEYSQLDPLKSEEKKIRRRDVESSEGTAVYGEERDYGEDEKKNRPSSNLQHLANGEQAER